MQTFETLKFESDVLIDQLDIDQGLPRTSVAKVSAGLLPVFRRPLLWGLRQFWDINVHDQIFVPSRGRVIIAANHVGTLDGPLTVLINNRPTFALAKNELFAGPVGWALAQGGQIPLHRDFPDVAALRRAVQVLRHEHPLVIFPEGARDSGEFETVWGGMAYLALVTGSPVVPCAIFGTRLAGAARKASPPRGSRIDVVFGHPIEVTAQLWPRRRRVVADVSEFLAARLRAHLRQAQQRTAQTLPGPVVED